MVLCPFAFRANNFSNVGSSCFNTGRAVGTKRRKMGGWGRRALKCTLSRSSAWELTCDVSKENEGSRGLRRSWVVPLASANEVSWSSTRSDEEPGRTPATTHSGATGERARGCAATARSVARDPVARKAAQIKVRSKFCAKNVEAAKFSKLALAEELATLGGCEPIYPLCKETLLTEAGALDKAGYRSTSLSCACDTLNSTLRFHRPSTGPSRRSMTPLQEVWDWPRKHLR